MFADYREKLDTEFQEAAAAEQAAQEAYLVDKERLETTIANLAKQEEELEFEIQELDKCIVTQTGIVEAAKSKRDRNQKLWDDAVAMCDAFVKEYEAASAARKEELALLALIRERVEARFAELSEGVTERGMQDEFSYDNEYEYEEDEFEYSGDE
jgi:16S rRNA G1207 methylase RsmC